MSIFDRKGALLLRWGLTCDLATNQDEALQALLKRNPDLILIDLHLDSGINGIDALDALRRLSGTQSPAALITADGSPELKQRARDLGLSVLLKPVRPGALRALLSALSRRSGKAAEADGDQDHHPVRRPAPVLALRKGQQQREQPRRDVQKPAAGDLAQG